MYRIVVVPFNQLGLYKQIKQNNNNKYNAYTNKSKQQLYADVPVRDWTALTKNPYILMYRQESVGTRLHLITVRRTTTSTGYRPTTVANPGS